MAPPKQYFALLHTSAHVATLTPQKRCLTPYHLSCLRWNELQSATITLLASSSVPSHPDFGLAPLSANVHAAQTCMGRCANVHGPHQQEARTSSGRSHPLTPASDGAFWTGSPNPSRCSLRSTPKPPTEYRTAHKQHTAGDTVSVALAFERR